jgi:hypothetical protein
VYKLPKSSKRRYSVVSLDVPRSSLTEDFVISPKSSDMALIKALDYFTHAELANGRYADFKASESARKAKTRSTRSKSLEPAMTAMEKLRAATEKVVAVNMLRHPMLANAGFAKADLGKVNDLKERLMSRKTGTR